ncbi:unnamed protein product [Echinostoma caproni]|uniref:Adenylate kinase 8 n=1 Tax=Echinostoma caproni TaxID=27848 RepID=A0A183AEU1_9TREM|nr:unnamed protein product [Echinostoma caproni]
MNDKTGAKELTEALKQRLKLPDCSSKGYILVGFPQNEAQAKAMRWEGIFPDYAIFLRAPMDVLIERTGGKRLDPVTNELYHLVTKPPPDVQTERRLIPLPDFSPEKTKRLIEQFERDGVLLRQIYAPVAWDVNCDQPVSDVFTTILSWVTQPARDLGLRTPRIILLGFTGSGRKTQAKLLAQKYGLIPIDCGLLIKTEIQNGSLLGKAMKSYVAKKIPVPDAILIEVIKGRLTQPDCTTRGWILHGYPRTRQQAEMLDAEGLAPNRVVGMNIAQVCAAERITGRRIDPVTGVRFHVAYRPKEESDISDRSLQHPQDVDCVVASKLARFAAHRDELYEYYEPVLIHVHANLDAHTVFEEIESGLVNPLPRSV